MLLLDSERSTRERLIFSPSASPSLKIHLFLAVEDSLLKFQLSEPSAIDTGDGYTSTAVRFSLSPLVSSLSLPLWHLISFPSLELPQPSEPLLLFFLPFGSAPRISSWQTQSRPMVSSVQLSLPLALSGSDASLSSFRSQMAQRPLRSWYLLLPLPSLPSTVLRSLPSVSTPGISHSLNNHLFSLLSTPLPEPNPAHSLPSQRQHRKLSSVPSSPSLRVPPLTRTKWIHQIGREQHRLCSTRFDLPSAAFEVRSSQP